jgi:large conductance mechanosensitive channel
MIIDGAKGFLAEFQTFASRGNFIDLAVGIVIGTSFSAVTNSLVTNIITPPLGLLLGRINFADLAIPLGGTVKITYGLFVQALISFIITAFALFLIVRFINRLQDIANRRKQKEASEPPVSAEDSPEIIVLKEIRDSLRPQQPSSDKAQISKEDIT